MNRTREAVAFFDAALRSFQSCPEAADPAPVYRIGGFEIALKLHGAALNPRLAMAFSHLAAPASQAAALSICGWDSSACRIAMPSPPWSTSDYDARGEIRGFNCPRFSTAFDHVAHALSMVDHERNLAIYWTRDASSLPAAELAAPFRTILHWWMERHSRVFVHCSAVGTGSGAALLAGRGGSGKSTTALLCLKAGMEYLADDYALLESAAPQRLFSLYQSAKLEHEHRRNLPDFEALADHGRATEAKALMFLKDRFGAAVIECLPTRVILLPRVTGGADTTLEPASAAEALRGLAPSSIFQLCGAGSAAFDSLAQVVRRVPCFRLQLGKDFTQIPRILADCLSRATL